MVRVSPSILVAATFSTTFLIGFWFFILPSLQQVGADRGIIEALNQHSAAPRARAKTGKTVNQAGQDQISKQVLELLPKEDNQYDISIQVDALSKSAGVTLVAISVNNGVIPDPTSKATSKSVTTSSGLNKVTINASVTGSYQNIQRFVVGLHTLSRFIQVDQLNISSAAPAVGSTPAAPTNGATAPSGDVITTQVVAFAFYLPASSSK